jgi:hypothetical protein
MTTQGKLGVLTDSTGKFSSYAIYCPGCKMIHQINPNVWSFDGDFENPTFSHSVLVEYPWGENREWKRCHSYIEDGKIRFLNDCTHEYAGETLLLEACHW